MITQNGAAQSSSGIGRVVGRVRASLVGDLVLLAVVLIAISWWVGTDVSYTSDEQAAVLQAQQLRAGGGWLAPNPLPSIDPTTEHFYAVLSDHGTAGVAFYAKHPAYPLVLVVLDALGGMTAMVLLSIGGAVAAAAATAGIARRIDPRLARWSLWASGVGSPLLFDSQLIVAHAIAAAFCGTAVLVGRPWLDPQRRDVGRLALAAGLVAAAGLLRTEAALFGLALAGWAVLRFIARRTWSWVAVAGLWAGASIGPVILDRKLLVSIVGAAVPDPASALPDADSSLTAKARAAVEMLLGAGDGWSSAGRLVLVVLFVGTVAMGLLLRRGGRLSPAHAVAGIATLVSALWLVTQPDAIRGILVVCPVLTVGLVLWRRPLLDVGPVPALATVAAGFTAAVALTTYAAGGGLEWGARYLAIALPVMVPLGVLSVHRSLTERDASLRNAAVAWLVALSLLIGVVAVSELRQARSVLRSVLANIERATAVTPGPDLGDGDRRPIVVTTMFPVGRLTLGPGPDVRGLTVLSDEALAEVARRLRDAGVERWVFISDTPKDLDVLAPWFRVAAREPDGRILVMSRT